MQITTANPSDFEEIIPYLDAAYNYAPGFFGGRLASQWNTDPEGVDWSLVFIVRGDDGKIASLVRVWEMQLIQAGRAITAGGIGSVSTAASARGQGGMSALIQHSVDAMRERGYPLGILWGDRFRYGSFGFETAGRAMYFEVGTRGLNRCQVEPLIPDEFSDETLAQIKTTYANAPYRRYRNPSEWPRLYNTPTRRVFASGSHNTYHDFGYFVLDQTRVIEWGGSIETVLRLAAYTAQQEIVNRWSFSLPHGVPVPQQLQRVMSSWSLGPGSCQAAMLDLPKTLDALELETSLEELSQFTATEQIWQLFGGPDAPRNLWLSSLDTI